MINKTVVQETVLQQMKDLEAIGLGHWVNVSPVRDKFLLQPDHPRAYNLTVRPDANGFIRSDRDSLLFRDPSLEFRRMLETMEKPLRASDKGIEFGWTYLDVSDVEAMFKTVRHLATSN